MCGFLGAVVLVRNLGGLERHTLAALQVGRKDYLCPLAVGPQPPDTDSNCLRPDSESVGHEET